jgi:pseudouridine synthase
MRLLLFNKPFRVLTRFRRGDERATLADFIAEPGVYPAGRLDYDSEGLLLLTDDGPLQSLITDPRHALEKVYLAQVEGVPDAAALARLRAGVALPDGRTRPAGARLIAEPAWLARGDPRGLARAQAARGPQPAGAAHDGCGRPPDAAARAHGGGAVATGRARTGSVARSAAGRARGLARAARAAQVRPASRPIRIATSSACS